MEMERLSSSVRNSGIVTALGSRLLAGGSVVDDPRRVVVRAVKVGVAVSLVSLGVYYGVQPAYASLAASAIWAILTVVVLFDFSVGATLGKGVLRMIATFVGGGVSLGAHRLAEFCGHTGEPILLFVFALILPAIFTFTRFFPVLKARYDYGLMIFVMTFSMVSASGYRYEEVFKVAWLRLVTVIVGCVVAMAICTFICPVWNGQELHNLIASNLDKLGSFLEGFGGECFKDSDEVKAEGENSCFVKYKSVLNTKTNEETMANFARWEPRHGRFRFRRHPWKQYLMIGNLTRRCAYKIEALSHHLNSDHSQVKPKIREHFKETCVRLSFESGKALKELSYGTKKMERASFRAKAHVEECKSASNELKALLNSNGVCLEALSLAHLLLVVTIASMLIEIAVCTEEISEAVERLEMSFSHLKGTTVSVAESNLDIEKNTYQGGGIGQG